MDKIREDLKKASDQCGFLLSHKDPVVRGFALGVMAALVYLNGESGGVYPDLILGADGEWYGTDSKGG